MLKTLTNFVAILAGIYLILCLVLYFTQERLIFYPEKLEKDYTFRFGQEFEELTFKTGDGVQLHGLLFPAEKSKGLVFYLHGNAGSLRSWGDVAQVYTDLDYDVLLLDYRGFGKSEGAIHSETQLFADNQLVYDEMKKRYSEDEIIVLGYSIGSGMASRLASENDPSQLILQAPYYSLVDLVGQKMPVVPSMVLKYKLRTNEYLQQCEMPITIFHGELDQLIPHSSAVRLKEESGDKINLVSLPGQGHNGITENSNYRQILKMIL